MLAVATTAQTKLIAFKSHSGSMHNFELALTNPKMDLVNHNLGAAPNPIIRNSEIDSVIFISDSVIIMVTTETCQPNQWYHRGDTTQKDLTSIWKEGKDTVPSHPLFSHNHSLDSIKNVLSMHYYFQNDINETVFIGFDNKNATSFDPMMDEDKDGINDNEEDENSAPVIVIPSNPSGGIGIILSSLFLASLLIGLMSWIMSRRTNNQLA
ncbi:MAG: hypothetical protein ACI857_001930 [Arenicella sp.]|jgi:hypothetical protein